MGTVFTEITLKNGGDLHDVNKGRIKPEEVRTATVTAIADTGALHTVITEELRQQLGLGIKGDINAHIANGQNLTCKLTDNVEITWKNRSIELPAMVIPGAKKILFGAIAFEALDLMVDPTTREVIGAHGDTITVLAL